MKIQLIQYNANAGEKDGITFSSLSSPLAIDDFDINVIDLSIKTMWTYKSDAVGNIDAKRDLDTIETMVDNKKKAIVLYVMPQNNSYFYNTSSTHKREVVLKDVLKDICTKTINKAIPQHSHINKLLYEKTVTTVSDNKYDADFYFFNHDKSITESDRSEKSTTIELNNQIFATTLNITQNTTLLKLYISTLFEEKKQTDTPAWMERVSFGDDEEQKKIITNCEEEIANAKAKIAGAQEKINANAEIKSILYTNGDQLVTVVFKILEELLKCDLSSFTDEKKEDFLIHVSGHTFIGEIKGVTSNVKYEHISQLELHYRKYLDTLETNGNTEDVKQLLVINPFRTKSLEDREPVNTSQIELAKRNNCLIIETNTLLRIYEKFCAKLITAEICVDVFATHTGLLSVHDFD